MHYIDILLLNATQASTWFPIKSRLLMANFRVRCIQALTNEICRLQTICIRQLGIGNVSLTPNGQWMVESKNVKAKSSSPQFLRLVSKIMSALKRVKESVFLMSRRLEIFPEHKMMVKEYVERLEILNKIEI